MFVNSEKFASVRSKWNDNRSSVRACDQDRCEGTQTGIRNTRHSPKFCLRRIQVIKEFLFKFMFLPSSALRLKPLEM